MEIVGAFLRAPFAVLLAALIGAALLYPEAGQAACTVAPATYSENCVAPDPTPWRWEATSVNYGVFESRESLIEAIRQTTLAVVHPKRCSFDLNSVSAPQNVGYQVSGLAGTE